MVKVAPEAVVMPKVVPRSIHPVSGRPSPSTSMICLLVAPAGMPEPVGAQPEVGWAAGAAVGAAVAGAGRAVSAAVVPAAGAVVACVVVVGTGELAVPGGDGVVPVGSVALGAAPHALNSSAPTSTVTMAAPRRVDIVLAQPGVRGLIGG